MLAWQPWIDYQFTPHIQRVVRSGPMRPLCEKFSQILSSAFDPAVDIFKASLLYLAPIYF